MTIRKTLVKAPDPTRRRQETTIVGHAPLFVIGVDPHARTHMLAVLACTSAIQYYYVPVVNNTE